MKKKWLWPCVMVLLLVWTVYMLLADQPPAQLWTGLRTADPLFLLAGFGLMGLFLACEALSTHLVLRILGTPAPLHRCLGYSCLGFYFSTVTPSSTGGQPMQVWSMAKDGIPAAHGALDMLLISICYQLAAALYALGAWVFFPRLTENLSMGLKLLFLFGFTSTLALAGVMVLFLVRPGWCSKLADALTVLLRYLPWCKDPRAFRGKLEEPIAQYTWGGSFLCRRPSLIPRLLGLSLCQLGCLYLVPWTVYRAFGLTGHSALELTALQALLPLPGAAGAAETAFLTGFAAFFGELVTPAVVLSRGISCYGMLLITGLVCLLIHFRRRRRDRAVQSGAVSFLPGQDGSTDHGGIGPGPSPVRDAGPHHPASLDTKSKIG